MISCSTEPVASFGQGRKRKTEPVAVTWERTAAATSTRPLPPWYAVRYGVGLLVLIRASFNWRAVQSGCFCASRTAAPVTCGEAIEVPLIVV